MRIVGVWKMKCGLATTCMVNDECMSKRRHSLLLLKRGVERVVYTLWSRSVYIRDLCKHGMLVD